MKSENELKVNDELIARYLSGEATPEEAIALNDWLEVGENRAHFEGLQATWDASNPSKKVRSIDKQEAWSKVALKTGPRGREISGIVWKTVAIAASVLLIAYVGLQFFYWNSRGPAITKAETGDSVRQVVLEDRSRITLYRNSRIVYPEEFQDSVRHVMLEKGEAFFSVEENKEKPFIVHADFAHIQVVGTEFNVSMNSDEVTVVVNEGKVRVYTYDDSLNSHSLYLQKGAAAKIRSRQAPQAAEVDPNISAYATRRLVFKDAPMSNVIGAIERTYGRSIRVSNDDVKKCKLTATFDNDSVENIVLLISESLNLKLERNGQVFILDGEGCP